MGHRVAKFAHGFEMRVVAYDPYISDEVFRKNRCDRAATLEDLLDITDILTVHVPLNRETRGLIGESELRRLKRGAWVINTARGGVISEQGLQKCLIEGHIAGAGIDTWENEPKPWPPLAALPNVVSTPHIGASTDEAQFRIGETIAIQILKALRGEIVDYPVNLPHVLVLEHAASRQMAVLAEKVGRIAAQILEFNPRSLRLVVASDVSPKEFSLLRLSAIKGFLGSASEEYVSHVNAERQLEKRGLTMEIAADSDGSVRSGMRLSVEGIASAEIATVGALLFDGEHQRLCLINGFVFEIELEGEILVLQNHDRPGVIGAIGSFLAAHNINIAQFELSRNRRGGKAMSLVKIDGEIPRPLLEEISAVANIISAKVVGGL